MARLSRRVAFPRGTLFVNLSGAFPLGVRMGSAATGSLLISPRLRVALGIVFIGAYMTFSTLVYELLAALRTGDLRIAVVTLVVSLAGSLLACWAGLVLGERR